MEKLRKHLKQQLAHKLDAHGLVVWQDDAEEYVDAAESIRRPDAGWARWDGSWYALRREVEELLSSDESPRLVVYAPAPAPTEDPLAEVRAAGSEFKLRIPTLLKQALSGEMTEARLVEIGRDARTLLEAEAALEAGDAGDVRMVAILGAADSVGMALRVLSSEAWDALDEHEAWDDAAGLLATAFGGEPAGVRDELVAATARQLLLTEIHRAAGGLPETLASTWGEASAEQERRTATLLDRWRYDSRYQASYRAAAKKVDEDLDLVHVLEWTDGLHGCWATPAIEALAFAEGVRMLDAGEFRPAAELAGHRLESSPWAQEMATAFHDEAHAWGSRWRAAQATAELRCVVEEAPAPTMGAGELLAWYAQCGWEVDRAHRKLELARGSLASFGDLEQPLVAARVAYERWLDDLLQVFTTAVAESDLVSDDLMEQGQIHARFVRGATGPVAYVWVDALRYEIGIELRDALRAAIEHVELYPAIGAAPSITPVGMANLCPDATSKLEVTLDEQDRLVVLHGSVEVRGVDERVELLRAAHGSVASLDLNEVSQQGEKELARSIANAELVLLRSQELDAAGESGMLSVAWPQFEAVRELLASVVARLGQAGIKRVVITADHGFVALSRRLEADRTVDPPGGSVGKLNRRSWIGRGGTTSEATLRVPLAVTGVTSDLDAIVPRGLAVFRSAGSGKQFFHGGLSPQELVVPVIVVELERAAEPQKLDLEVSVAGDRVTTGAFAATLFFHGDLFTNEITVRVFVKRDEGKEVVARVVSGDGFNPETGSITIPTDRESVLTFRVTSNLQQGSELELQVLDARTGKTLDMATATVAADVIVEDTLD